jgi:hypothetical protein
MSDFLSCARWTDKQHPEPHQIAAWNWAWQLLTKEQQVEFLELFRSAVPSKVGEVANSWSGVLGAAKESGARFPELVAAQWALESGWGKHTSGKNNYFGLKGSGSDVSTQEFVNNQWVTVNAGFVDFPNLRTCVQYLVDRWHKNYKQYKGVNNAKDRNSAAAMLVSEGYATDPDYSKKLIALMDANAPAAPGPPAIQQEKVNPLPVPWFSQRDSGTDQAARMCFSSSCAMLLEFLKPGTLKGPNGDDQYLKTVQKYGDTTDANAQVKALGSYGVMSRFIQNADFALLKQQIDKGVPVPCGFIHRGPVDNPTGGGHWLIAIGYDTSGIIVNDPWGEADLLNGSTVNSNGRNKKYSYTNFGRRWMVQGSSGNYRYAPGNGWAIVTDSWK